MKGEILFEKMTNISDEYVNEAAIGEAYGNQRRAREESALSRLLNSGWFVATVCAVISLCVVVALVRWGQAGSPAGPAGVPSDTANTSASGFEFSYELLDADGALLTAPVSPGDRIVVNATVINRGLPFLYTGSSSEFCPDVRLIHEGDKTTVLHGIFAHVEDFGTFLVKTGEVGQVHCDIDIPNDAPDGVYNLVLSYKDAEQVFVGALRVEDHSQKETETESETERETLTEPETAPEPETEPAPPEIPILDDATRSYLRNAYAAAHPSVIPSDISISRYYGTFPSGAIVAKISDGQTDVTTAFWEEPVGSYLIPYSNGSRIEVCYNEAFYTLTEAYRNGFLSDADVAVIHALQCEYGGFVNNGPTFDREATYDREDSFGFAYELIDGVFLPGASVRVRVSITNQMICDYEWVGSSSAFMPHVKFVLTTDTEYVITPAEPNLTDDFVYNIVAPWEKRYCDFYFTIPADAPPGQYHLVCSFRNSQQTFAGEEAEFWFE